MKRWLRRWWPALAMPMVAAFAFALGWWLKPIPDPEPPRRPKQLYAWNCGVGQREEDLRKEYGPPLVEKAGYHHLTEDHLWRGSSRPTGAVRTLCFQDNTLRISDTSGRLWVWLEQRGDHWGCFQSFWCDHSVSDRYQLGIPDR